MSSKNELYELIAKNIDNKSFNLPKKGETIEAKIVAEHKKHYLLSIQDGIDAILPKTEVVRGDEKLKVGKMTNAFVLKSEDDSCHLILSQKRTDSSQVWEMLENAQKEGSTIEVIVTESNSGGLIVNFEGVSGFIPTSQLDPLKVYTHLAGESTNKEDLQKEVSATLAEFKGTKLKVMVVEASRSKSKLILSEKFILSEQNAAGRSEALKTAKISDVLEAEVTAITPYGVFVNANGLDGLIHLSELSWEKVEDPNVFAKVGEKIRVKLIDINTDGTRIAFSIKQLYDDPWMKIARELKIGESIEVTINEILEYGLIVRIEGTVNGLIHKNEIPENKSSDLHTSFTVGETIKAIVMTVSPSERKIGLTLKKLNTKTITKNEDKTKSYESNNRDNSDNQHTLKSGSKNNSKKRLKSKLNLDEALSNFKASR